MIASRASALLLSLALVSPAAAQVRAIPAEAGAAPLTAHNTGISPVLMTPALSGAALASSLSEPSVVTAPSALLPRTNAAAAQSVQAAAARPTALVAASARAPEETRSGASSLMPANSDARRPSSTDAPAAGAEAMAAAAETPLDQLYDGRAEAENRSSLALQGTDSEHGPALLPSPPPRIRGRAEKIVDVAVPVAVAGVVALGFASPHLGLAVLHGLGNTAYWIANPLAFMFTMPQIYRILKHRSAEVSKMMTAIGLVSSLVTVLGFAFDGKSLMMYRTLAQTVGFAAMLGLEAKYSGAKERKVPSRRRTLIETGAVVLVLGAVLALAGPALMATIPAVALMSHLLVPFQILSGFGFTYMMYAQLRKMYLDHSSGDASSGMMWAYLGTKIIWIWSLATMLSLVAAPVGLTLAVAALFTGASWLATRFALTYLIHTPWTFLPEKIVFRGRTLTRRAMGDALAFLALSALTMALSGIGYFAFSSLLAVKAGESALFAMYLFYTVKNLISAMATAKTLRLQGRLGRKALNPRP